MMTLYLSQLGNVLANLDKKCLVQIKDRKFSLLEILDQLFYTFPWFCHWNQDSIFLQSVTHHVRDGDLNYLIESLDNLVDFMRLFAAGKCYQSMGSF